MGGVEDLQGAAGAREVGAVHAQAFRDDPVWCWLLRGGDRQRRLARVFAGFAATAARTPGGRLLVTPERSAAAVWLPPGRWQPGPVEQARTAPGTALALRGGVLRGLRLQAVTARHHPREEHWYLEALGAARPGGGAGRRVVQPVLDACDDAGLPAYLESSNPRNRPFYERLGFVALDPLPVPRGCPPLVPMRRAPR